MRFVVWLGLLAGSAYAQPIEVISGQDLEAWRMIEQQDLQGEAAVSAYRDFVRTFPSSSLAEAAWRRLVELDDGDGEWTQDAALRPLVADLRESWRQHQAALDRQPTASVVAPLTVEPAPTHAGLRWRCNTDGLTGSPRARACR